MRNNSTIRCDENDKIEWLVLWKNLEKSPLKRLRFDTCTSRQSFLLEISIFVTNSLRLALSRRFREMDQRGEKSFVLLENHKRLSRVVILGFRYPGETLRAHSRFYYRQLFSALSRFWSFPYWSSRQSETLLRRPAFIRLNMQYVGNNNFRDRGIIIIYNYIIYLYTLHATLHIYKNSISNLKRRTDGFRLCATTSKKKIPFSCYSLPLSFSTRHFAPPTAFSSNVCSFERNVPHM